MPPLNSPPAAICRQRLKRKGGWRSAIACSLVGVSHRARRARVNCSVPWIAAAGRCPCSLAAVPDAERGRCR